MIKLTTLTEQDAWHVSHFAKENFNEFFNPHSVEEKDIEKILVDSKKDLYLGLFFHGELAAYGLLRGMDEGYEIPSLGICVDYKYRGFGHGRSMMEFLHLTCKANGYKKIRLLVDKNNEKAISLYREFGYTFSDYGYTEKYPNHLLGIKELYEY